MVSVAVWWSFFFFFWWMGDCSVKQGTFPLSFCIRRLFHAIDQRYNVILLHRDESRVRTPFSLKQTPFSGWKQWFENLRESRKNKGEKTKQFETSLLLNGLLHWTICLLMRKWRPPNAYALTFFSNLFLFVSFQFLSGVHRAASESGLSESWCRCWTPTPLQWLKKFEVRFGRT